MKIGICVPARDNVHAGFAKCLADLTASLTKDNIEFELLIVIGSVIPQQRNDLTDIAIIKKCTHILWLDSDMYFPDNTVQQLLSHKKEIVAATYSTRAKPYRSVAFTDPNNLKNRLEATTGLHQVWAVGLGCMLTDITVYSNISKPWFNYIWNQDTKDLSGEDIFFCKTANDTGYEVYVDADLSQQVAHIGSKAFLIGEVK